MGRLVMEDASLDAVPDICPVPRATVQVCDGYVVLRWSCGVDLAYSGEVRDDLLDRLHLLAHERDIARIQAGKAARSEDA